MASIQNIQNASFASPVADAAYGFIAENPILEGVISTIAGLSAWQIALSVFLGLVAYDQSMSA
jgi:hypothetical protein